MKYAISIVYKRVMNYRLHSRHKLIWQSIYNVIFAPSLPREKFAYTLLQYGACQVSCALYRNRYIFQILEKETLDIFVFCYLFLCSIAF